jgi:pseudaminic acid biosynthesis-associated methylase
MNRETSNKYRTEQEAFWAGEFGSNYIERNQGEKLLASNLNFFSKALASARELKSCIEFGANIGMNLKALRLLYPSVDLHAIEINEDAVQELRRFIPNHQIHHTSILDFEPKNTCDLVLIKGVLIHLNPEMLQDVYDRLAASTNRYLLIAEYYNPSPVSIAYRGHNDKLFKRDFAGEVMERRPEFRLVDYGFTYRKDPSFPQDDITWFLMEK